MDQLGRLRRGAGGEVGPLHQCGAQAPGGGVEGHAGAGDAAADNQHVETLGGHAGQRGVAVERAVGSAGHPFEAYAPGKGVDFGNRSVR